MRVLLFAVVVLLLLFAVSCGSTDELPREEQMVNIVDEYFDCLPADRNDFSNFCEERALRNIRSVCGPIIVDECVERGKQMFNRMIRSDYRRNL